MGVRERRRRRRYAAVVRRSVAVVTGIVLCSAILYFGNAIKQDETDGESEPQTELSEKVFDTTEIYLEKESVNDAESDSEFPVMSSVQKEYQRIQNLPAGELASAGIVSEELTERLFYSTQIDEALLSKINGVSYTQNEYIDITDLRYLKMLYYGGDGNTYVGEMLVNQKIADTVLDIFKTLYENQYPIEQMVLVDNYEADDELSMSSNNTSAFNYRPIAGSSKLSKHSYGMAIDLNPKYNPCVKTAADGSIICQPENGLDYADRSKDFPYKIDENDLAHQLFTQAGFTWGGSWNSLKDYQHFEMSE